MFGEDNTSIRITALYSQEERSNGLARRASEQGERLVLTRRPAHRTRERNRGVTPVANPA